MIYLADKKLFSQNLMLFRALVSLLLEKIRKVKGMSLRITNISTTVFSLPRLQSDNSDDLIPYLTY